MLTCIKYFIFNDIPIIRDQTWGVTHLIIIIYTKLAIFGAKLYFLYK